MKMHATLAFLSAAMIGQVFGQDAPAVTDNPVGVTYRATLPEERFFKNADLEGNARGYISAVAAEGGNGVTFKVRFENLPKEGGPFMYHIHVEPSATNNCTATLAHLDPFARGEEPICDPSAPETCQVGDLSGKWGEIESDPFEDEYTDLYASTKEGIGAFFGNRSFVLHYANKTRLTCANFEEVPSNSTTGRPTTTGPVPTATEEVVNAAGTNVMSIPLALVGLAAIAFAL